MRGGLRPKRGEPQENSPGNKKKKEKKEAGGRPLRPKRPGRRAPQMVPEQPWLLRGQRTRAGREEGHPVVKFA